MCLVLSGGLFDIHKMQDIFDIGYHFTKELLQNTKKLSLT